MSRLQIDLDDGTADALASLAAARGTAPADLVAEIVIRYVKRSDEATTASTGAAMDDDEVNRALTGMSIDELRKRLAASQGERWFPQPDPIDALVGSVDVDPVDDIDEVIYGR